MGQPPAGGGPAGAYTLSDRQSSEMPEKRPHNAKMESCGHTGPHHVALRGAVQLCGGCGAAHLRAPVGGAANGTPSHCVTIPSVEPITGP